MSDQVEGCPVCSRVRKRCVYHAARDPNEIARTLERDVSKRGPVAVADFYAAGCLGMATMPRLLLARVPQLSTAQLEAQLNALAQQPEMDADRFRELGACALALATTLEVLDDADEETDDDR